MVFTVLNVNIVLSNLLVNFMLLTSTFQWDCCQLIYGRVFLGGTKYLRSGSFSLPLNFYVINLSIIVLDWNIISFINTQREQSVREPGRDGTLLKSESGKFEPINYDCVILINDYNYLRLLPLHYKRVCVVDI